MAQLKITSGKQKGERIPIDRDEISIGRAPDNVVTIDDPSVSGHHAVIKREGRRFTLCDLGSTNGTRLNGVKIEKFQLSARDDFSIGSIDIVIEGDDIESNLHDEVPPTIVQPPVAVDKEPHVGNSGQTNAFQKRKSSHGVLTMVGVAVVIILLGLLGWFAIGLFRK